VLGLVLSGAPELDPSCPGPVRRAGEALVAVRVAGVCDTDLQLARGYMGFRGIPGHEMIGTVLEAEDARWVGRRVVADINAGCGECADCLGDGRGHLPGHHCVRRTVLGIVGRSGAFAERLVVPERCLVGVPDEVSDDLAVFAEPVAAALHVEDELSTDAGPIAVLGDGKLGLLIALALGGRGHDVTLIGRHAHKLAIAAAAGIATLLEEDARGAVGRFGVTVDATGSPSGLALALASTRPRGTVVLKTTVAEPIPVELSIAVVNELRLVGSRCGDMRAAVAALAAGAIDPSPLIEARYGLSSAVSALEHAGRKGALKVLIDVAAR
jgi:threonine dehydrogenase-like Zn-dependent dehydrogenase